MDRKPRGPLYPLLCLIGAQGVYYLFVNPPKQGVAEMSPRYKNLMRASGVAKSCKSYSVAHGGQFPTTLAKLELEEESLYLDPESRQRMDWLFFPSATAANAPPDQLLLASPIHDDKHRIVAFADFTAKIIKEEEFQSSYPEARSK